MNLLDIYSLYIAHWLNGGEFLRRGKMSGNSIKTDYNAIMTKQSIKRVFRISVIVTDNFDLSFLDLIRYRMFEECPNVETMFNITNYPVKIEISSDKYAQALARAARKYEDYKSAFESQDSTAKLTGKVYRMPGGGAIRLSKETLDNLRMIYNSYEYVFQYVADGGSMMLTNMFIEASANSIKDLNNYRMKLFNLASQLKINCAEVRGVNRAFLTAFGPAAPPQKTLNKKFLPQLLFSDENLAAFSTYTSRGLVCDAGILLGMDFRSKLPFMANLFETSSAQVTIIGGKTGSGKTYAAFQLALSLAGIGVHISAIDIKGREWIKVGKYIKHKVITFDEKHPNFVNILRIDDMQATIENSKEVYNTAVNGVVMLLSLMVGLPEDDERVPDLNMFLRSAVQKLYSNCNVNPDNPKSFANSANLKYQDLMPLLSDLTLCQSYTTAQKEVADLARSRCSNYIGESGIFADSFQNEITLGDIMHTPLVIYEFNKNNTVMSDILDVLRIFMVQFLDTKKKASLKQKGSFLACFYEELQRCPQFGNLIEYICADVTGSRSNNVLVYLLLNSLAVLQQGRAQDIKSNITSFILGKMEPDDITSIGAEFNQKWLASQLRIFHEKNVEYNNCFAAHIDTGAHVYETVYKVVLPDDISESFRTRDIRGDMVV